MSSYFTAGFQTGKEKTGKRKGNSLATGEGTERGQQRDKSGKRHSRADNGRTERKQKQNL